MDATNLSRRLRGAPPALPTRLDRISERWWRTGPRMRAAVIVSLVIAVLAAGIGQAASSPWGPPTTARVAARDLGTGTVLGPGDLERRSWPVALLPSAAVDHDPLGATLLAPLPAGSVLTEAHLGRDGLGAGLVAGDAAIAVPFELLTVATPGMHVDLVGVDLDGRGVRLAGDATVLAVDMDEVWVTVPRDAAPDVAAATVAGSLALVVVPAPSGGAEQAAG